jgi:putative ABC transport system permease protein
VFEVRLRKLLGDLRAEPGRVGLMVTAIAVSLIAVGAVLGAYAILTREIAVNYRGTQPASATLELSDGADAELLERVRRDPLVSDAEAREVVLARARVGRDLRPLLLFVIDDFAALRVNTFRPESGAWPPPTGTMLIERSAREMLAASTGQSVIVKTPNGTPTAVPISGLVHDPGLAPAWQEREGYGYVTRATLAGLGEAPILHELRVRLRDESSQAGVEMRARELGNRLAASGHRVEQIRVPPLHQHPHQRQMVTILFLLLIFSVLALALSAILVATSLSALLARQVREIGVMKTIGAKTGQIAGLYLVLVSALGGLSIVLSLPLGIAGARGFSRAVAAMLNFTLTSIEQPHWVFLVQAAAGLCVPLLVASVPIFRAARITVRQALDQFGVSADTIRPRYSALPPALRNALRRPARLALTLLLLAAGGAMFMTALNVSRGWQRNLAKIYETRKYDVEIRLHAAQPLALAERLRVVPGVQRVEAWGYAPAAFATTGQLDIVRTYPDRGHGSLSMLAPPPATQLIQLPLRAGRWLRADDSDAVVLNHVALAQAKGATVGSRVSLSIDGQVSDWRVVGVVEEIGAAGVAYVTDAAFARATGSTGRARLLRVATLARTPSEREDTIRRLDQRVTEAGFGIDAAVPLAELRSAVGDHVVILIRALLAMAVVMAVVGALGLGSTMGVSVLERTREFGVLKTLGATPRRVANLVLAEAAFVAGASFLLAFAFAVPLTFGVDALVGNLGFLAPLPLVIGLGPAVTWLVLTALVALVATWFPAQRAARLSVRDALACT